MLSVLREQMAAHEKARDEEAKIKQEEHELLVSRINYNNREISKSSYIHSRVFF